MDLAMNAFRGETLERLSSQLGESPDATQRGLAQVVPMTLAGVAHQAKSEHGARELLGSLRDGTAPEADPSELAHMVSDPAATTRMAQSGAGFASRFLGDKLGPMLNMVTGQSGLSRSSTSTLFGLAAPLVLGLIGKQAKAKNLDASGLSRLLTDEAQKASGHLPASFASIFGAGAGPEQAREQVSTGRAQVEQRYRPAQREKRTHGLGWVLAGLVALLAVGWWVFRREPKVADVDVRPPEVAMPGVPAPDETATPRLSERQTVAGTDVITMSGDADELEVFFKSTAPTPQRFVLEGLEFDTASSRIASSAMLDDAARALQAHPEAELRIEGHTDRQGKGQDNQALSLNRANAVKSYLVSKGVPAHQLEAIGMSELNPIADNETPEGRARNRRVELIVIQR